jgi:ParB-like chromosome segregation protein Spo0J
MEEEVVRQVPIAEIDPRWDKRFRKDYGDIEALARSMAEPNGLVQPIVLNSSLVLRSGGRRLKAAMHLGWTTINAYIKDGDFPDPARAEDTENNSKFRKDFTPEEQVAMYRGLTSGNRPGARTDLKDCIIPQEEALAEAGFANESEMLRTEAVVTKATPELKEAFNEGKVALSVAASAAELPPDEQAKVASAAKERGSLAASKKKKEVQQRLVANKGSQALRDALAGGAITLERAAKLAQKSLGAQDDTIRDTLAGKTSGKKSAVVERRNGQVKFDDRVIRTMIQKMARLFTDRMVAYGGDCPGWRATSAALENLSVQFQEWQKATK